MAVTDDTRPDARQRLLERAVEHVVANGVGDLSLRALAAELGTSHRMLLYHFGSKEQLLVEIVRAQEARQLAIQHELASDPTLTPGDAMRRMWRQLSRPANWPQIRLFFELYGQAVQGRPGTTGVLDGIVDSWIEPFAAIERQRGVPAAAARANATLGLAVVRGLLLDLVATGEKRRVDAAMEQFISAYEAGAFFPSPSSPSSGTKRNTRRSRPLRST